MVKSFTMALCLVFASCSSPTTTNTRVQSEITVPPPQTAGFSGILNDTLWTGGASAAIQIINGASILKLDFDGNQEIEVFLIHPLLSASSYRIGSPTSSTSYDSCWAVASGLWISKANSNGTIVISKVDTVKNLLSGALDVTVIGDNGQVHARTCTFRDIPYVSRGEISGSISWIQNGQPMNEPVSYHHSVSKSSTGSYLPFLGGGSISLHIDSLMVGSHSFNGSLYTGSESYGKIPRSGFLSLTSVDTTSRKFSGVFSFDAVNRIGDTVHVTNGVLNNIQWFDVF